MGTSSTIDGRPLGTEYLDGKVVYTSALESFDDGPQKPRHI